MKCIPKTIVALIFLGSCLLPPTSINAQIELRFSPQDTTLNTGESARLSIMLDDAIDLRTIEVSIAYDPDVIESLGGESGQGFIDTGCLLFDGFDDSAPGVWYGYCVIIGADCWLTGPAELFSWDFLAVASGNSAFEALDLVLYSPEAEVIEEVSLPESTVIIEGDISDVPPSTAGLNVNVFPNPFNPNTSITFSVDRELKIAVDVLALDGSRVTTLADRIFLPGQHFLRWNGSNSRGQGMPSGVYLVRLKYDSGLSVRKMMLAR